MDSLLQDVRYAYRLLWKSPVFSIIAVASLALGIGGNTAIFSLVDAMLLRPLPQVEKPQQLVWMSRSYSYPLFEYFRAHSKSFDAMFGQSSAAMSVRTGNEEAQPAWGQLVTANYFDVLRVRLPLGRGFLPAEDTGEGKHPVAVLSYRYWQKRFSGDPGVIGRVVRLNGQPFTIVGVTPQGFLGVEA